MTRSALSWLTFVLVSVGALFLAYVFASSLNPSARALAEIPRARIPILVPGQFAFVKSPVWRDAEWMFVRRLDGKLNVWHIPTRHGERVLPDYPWWVGWTTCKNFGPRFDKGVISCRDDDLEEWVKRKYVWTLDGKAVDGGGIVSDLHHVVGFEEFGDYVAGVKRD